MRLTRGILPFSVTCAMASAAWSGGAWAEGIDHSPWDKLLRAHVQGGAVAYSALKRSPKAMDSLAGYLRTLATTDPAALPKQEELAFWLNAYNACIVASVLAEWPLRSVMEASQFFKKPRCEVAGKKRSPDEIENEAIRPKFAEPRIHFALSNGTRSGAPLRAAAYDARTLDRDLDAVTRAYLSSSRGLAMEGRTIRLSAVFNWFADDFTRAAGSVERFIERYRKLPSAVKIAFLDYDWRLNGN